MARQAEEVLKNQLGSLLFEIAILTSKVEGLQEQVNKASEPVNEAKKGKSNG